MQVSRTVKSIVGTQNHQFFQMIHKPRASLRFSDKKTPYNLVLIIGCEKEMGYGTMYFYFAEFCRIFRIFRIVAPWGPGLQTSGSPLSCSREAIPRFLSITLIVLRTVLGERYSF